MKHFAVLINLFLIHSLKPSCNIEQPLEMPPTFSQWKSCQLQYCWKNTSEVNVFTMNFMALSWNWKTNSNNWKIQDKPKIFSDEGIHRLALRPICSSKARYHFVRGGRG